MKPAKVPCLVVVLALLVTALPLAAQTPQPDIERRINSLISRMTLEEKLGQLQQLDGEANGNYRPEHLEMIRKGQLGSTLNVRGARRVNELQHIAMDQSRLKIPVLFSFDVIHGYRTVFPVPLAMASSWDPKAPERAASVAAAEASAAGLKWTFAPMLDISRDPRWGRIVEGAGEDPYLGAAMARAQVRGFQGSNYAAADKVVACAKHWVGYGAAEAGRDYNTTDISEGRLRDIYFPPFQAAIDAGVGTFMSSFNDLNGVPGTANPFTLTKVLRGEWKFDGLVVSDYQSVKELINHGLAAGEPEAATSALNAGVDMEMVSRLYNQYGPQLLKDGKISTPTIDEAVRRVLRIKFRTGIFDNPYADETRESKELLSAGNLAAAREVAARSMVLLKNDRQLLPLSKDVKSVALVGPFVENQLDLMGSWTGDGRADDVVTILAGIRSKVSPKTTLTYTHGCDVKCESTDGFAEAVSAARNADVAVVVVGESADMSGEAASRSMIDLPGRQLDLVKAIQATGKPTVVVLLNGRPLTINWIAENTPAILESWFPGTQGGNAIADVLFGDVSPGGKLPVTFPRSVGQIPIYYNHKSTGRPANPADKYTSKYLNLPVTPLFPFGFGLSYTEFRLSNLQLSAQTIRPDGTLTVGADLENVGKRTGDEVVQLYIRDIAASVTQPVKALKGFERVTLRPGEKRHLTFTLSPRELGFHNREMRFVVEPGKFNVTVGTSSVDGLEGSFEVK